MHALTLEEYFVKYVLSEMELDEAEVNEIGEHFEDESFSVEDTTQASEEGDYYTVRNHQRITSESSSKKIFKILGLG